MIDVRFAKAKVSHAYELAGQMRAGDVAEVRAAGQTPIQAILESLDASTVAVTVFFGSRVALMFGVTPRAPAETVLGSCEVGWAWLLTGKVVDRHPKAFLKNCPAGLALLLEHYPVLVSYIDERYAAALRWAKWLGFELGEARENERGHRFVSAKLRRTSWVQ